jgi:hypothetical protein
MENLLLVIFSGLLLSGLAWQVSHFISKEESSHDIYLLAGAAYYLLIPFVTYIYGGYSDGPGHALWQSQFKEAAGSMKWYMLFYITVCFPAYVASSIVLLPKPRWVEPERNNSSIGLVALLGIISCFNIYAISQVIGFLFRGYTIGYNPDLYGPLCGVSLAILLFYLYCCDLARMEDRKVVRWIRSALIAILLVDSAAMISLGVRTYVIIILASLAARRLYASQGVKNLGKRWKTINLIKLKRKTFAYLAIIPILITCFVLVGVSRMGIFPSIEDLIPYLTAESVLNSISLSGANTRCLGETVLYINFPSDVVAAFMNLIPSALLSDKATLLPQQSDCISSALGGVQITASLLANFGVLGSSIAVFIFGCWLNTAERSAGSSCLWLYSYVSGCCISMVFRDPLSISIKVIALYPIAFRLIAKMAHRLGSVTRIPAR